MMSQTQREIDFQNLSYGLRGNATGPYVVPDSMNGLPISQNTAADKDMNSSVRSSVSYY